MMVNNSCFIMAIALNIAFECILLVYLPGVCFETIIATGKFREQIRTDPAKLEV